MLREEKARGTEIGREAERWTVEGSCSLTSLLYESFGIGSIIGAGSFLTVFREPLGRPGRSTRTLKSVSCRSTPSICSCCLRPWSGAHDHTLTCSRCSSVFNERFHNVSNTTPCPKCGGELVRRNDDTEEALDRRLAQFRECTVPVAIIIRKKVC